MKSKTIFIDKQDEVDIDFFVDCKLYANPSYAMRHWIKDGIAEELKRMALRQNLKGNGGVK